MQGTYSLLANGEVDYKIITVKLLKMFIIVQQALNYALLCVK